MKKLLLIFTFLLTVSTAAFAGCAGTKPSGSTKTHDNEYTVQEHTEENEDNPHCHKPRMPRPHHESTENLTEDGDNGEEVPEAPRLKPHKPRKKHYPVPLPEHRPVQPK